MKRAVKGTEKPAVKAAAAEAAAAVEKNETVKTVAKAAGRTAKAAEKTVKEAAKKVEEVTTEAKKTVAKAAEKKAVKETVYLQYMGKEISKDDLMKQVKDIWTKQMKKKVGDMKTVTLYLKPEENKAYYVINGDVTGSVEM